MVPLTKTLHPGDFSELDELLIVDKHFQAARAQHPMRRWEYAMALHAYRSWRGNATGGTLCYDIGGAGSPFRLMLSDYPQPTHAVVVDPDGGPGDWKSSLADFVQPGTELGHAVFCLSVLEHVDDLDQFLYHLACLVAPGGLLFFTVDCCAGKQSDVEDIYHFHWMRKRIFSELDWQNLYHTLRHYQFHLFGNVDTTHHGNHVYDYTFASLALVKRT